MSKSVFGLGRDLCSIPAPMAGCEPKLDSSTEEVIKRLEECERWLKDTEFELEVWDAQELFSSGNIEATRLKLALLPTRETLLDGLINKLKGKSVYKTLVRIRDGSIENNFEYLKGLFSLGTHISIECSQGRKEYGLLLPLVFEKIGEVLFVN